MTELSHRPVLLFECINGLNIKKDGIYLDGTLGMGGHAREILKRLDTGRLIALDKDYTAIEFARKSLSEFGDRLFAVQSDFASIESVMASLEIEAFDGMLFDLGVSSPQLDDARRGFSYMHEAPLDMRMDKFSALTAHDVVNTYSVIDLKRILRDYGEERYAERIANAIVRKRQVISIETTLELVDIIKSAMPGSALREKQHPAKRSFQALRIEVNNELGSIKHLLDIAPRHLKRGGKIGIISFHSLEDRLVKLSFRKYNNGCVCPSDFPVCSCGFEKTLDIITPRPITASDSEVRENPRARSAKLRIAQKC